MVTIHEALVIDGIAARVGSILFDAWRKDRGYHRGACAIYSETRLGLVCNCPCRSIQIQSGLPRGEEPERQVTMITRGGPHKWAGTWCTEDVVTAADLNGYVKQTDERLMRAYRPDQNEYDQRTYPELDTVDVRPSSDMLMEAGPAIGARRDVQQIYIDGVWRTIEE